MTDKEILQRAVATAASNGYDPSRKLHTYDNYYELIFSHDFSRAFFGVDYTKDYYDTTPNTGWAWHLQQMVIQYEPLKYLEKFLEEETV